VGVFPETGSLPSMIVNIFFFSLIVSAFCVVTLPGLVFFAFPAVILALRVALWGATINQLPTPQFLAAFPTLILEGEGYVVASMAGIILGLSWLKPELAYKGEGLSRLKALKKALKECVYMYVLVTMILLVAAIVESITIALY
jgi:hypothetical protein